MTEVDSISKVTLADPVTDLTSAWQKTLSTSIRLVVSLHFSSPCAVEFGDIGTGQATGFVVDAKRGIILTNRHVVGPGPFFGYAVFDNHEEAVVKPIYRDPVHDFGFLRYDTSEIKYMEVHEIMLDPEGASVGTEIRVVGNDAGEKLSILGGIISRIDRMAPNYGDETYNDFNTEYFQASASATGGSSGSPVIDIKGNAVALQAGGMWGASTDFFLPLSRPKRALECIQLGKPITRGDIQVKWELRPFEECERLGLSEEYLMEARAIFPRNIGLLQAVVVLPEGPADGKIQEGDTLISIDGHFIGGHVLVDELLDERIGKSVEFVFQRNKTTHKEKITVGDIHSITLNKFITINNEAFFPASYQNAMASYVPIRGVCNGRGKYVIRINDKPVTDLESFINIVKEIPDLQKFEWVEEAKQWHSFFPNREIKRFVRNSNPGMFLATRNDEKGIWDFELLQKEPLAPIKPSPKKGTFSVPSFSNESCNLLAKSFVTIQYNELRYDVCQSSPLSTHGLVLDADKGYVITSQSYVNIEVSFVVIIFAKSIEVEAQIIYSDPCKNYTILKYDPSLVEADVQTPTFEQKKPLEVSDEVFLVGIMEEGELVCKSTAVSNISIFPNQKFIFNVPNIKVSLLILQKCEFGVYIDNEGKVRAIVFDTNTYSWDERENFALDVTSLVSILEQLREDGIINPTQILDVPFQKISLNNARTKGVSDKWISKFDATKRQNELFVVSLVPATFLKGTPKQSLQIGDIVLTINGEIFDNLGILPKFEQEKHLKLKVVREKQEHDFEVPTLDTSIFKVELAVVWCGIVVRKPDAALRLERKQIYLGVYISDCLTGSPAQLYGVDTDAFITHVNDEPTPDMDEFIKIITNIPDATFARIRYFPKMTPEIRSIRTHYHYFPTIGLKDNR